MNSRNWIAACNRCSRFRAQEVMSLKSSKHPCVTLALIASMPRVFEAVQDKCIVKANCKKDSKSFYVSCCDCFC